METSDMEEIATGDQFEEIYESDFECDASEGNETNEEDTQSDNDDVVMEIQPLNDHVLNATNILSNNLSVNHENALALNSAMQTQLMNLREMLEDLLHKSQQKYNRNSELLLQLKRTICIRPPYRRCGAPYFKDTKNNTAPANDDYVMRSTVKRELFLMDLKLVQRYWLVGDKCNLVNAVKSQVVDYLNADAKNKNREDISDIETYDKLSSSRLAILLEKAGEHFTIDFEQISKFDLSGRHSEKNCYAMWHGYMKPQINRNKWTKEENDGLMAIAEKHNFQNWSLISKELSGRSENQCFVQFQNTVNSTLPNNRKWTTYEDQTLLKAVKNHTLGHTIDWNSIRGYFINRNRKGLSQRYRLVLNPKIKKSRFTREEDCVLLAAIEEYGENFACIPMTLFPNRTRKQIKSRYLNTVRYSKIQRCWTMQDDEKLLEYVKENGTGRWSEIANILKVHSRTSCRTRYNVIERFIKKNPNATIQDLPRKKKGLLTDVNKDNWVEKIYELKTQGDLKAMEVERRNEIKRQRPNNYRNLLRPVHRHLYEMFKFSYDFKFAVPSAYRDIVTKTLPMFGYALELDVSNLQMKSLEKILTGREHQLLQTLLYKRNKNKGGRSIGSGQIPANWCTLLGFRALTILKQSDNYKSIVQKSTAPLKGSQMPAESIFRERFMKMFYKTALLTKLDPKTAISKRVTLKYVAKKQADHTSKNTDDDCQIISGPSQCPKRQRCDQI